MNKKILALFRREVVAYFDQCGAGAASPDHLRAEVYVALQYRHSKERVLLHISRLARALVRIEDECRKQAPCKPADEAIAKVR